MDDRIPRTRLGRSGDEGDDGALIHRAKRGDDFAFEELYRRHSLWALRVARRFAANEDEAQDIVQDAFLYLLDRLPRMELTSKLTTFLYPVIKHRAIDLRRRRRPEQAAEFVEFESPTTPPRGSIDNSALRDAVDRLPEAQREVLLMRYVDDMKLAEIAAALSVPVGTVKSRLHHALESLRRDGAIRDLR